MAEQKQEAAKQEKAPVVVDDLVEVRCLRPFIANKIVVQPGQTVKVTKDEARELVRDFVGTFAWRGERYTEDGDGKRHVLKRAEYTTPQAS